MTNWQDKVKFINSRQMVGSDGDDASPFGSDLVINGRFDIPANWGCGVGWAIAGGLLVATNVAIGTNTQQPILALVPGRKYRTRYTLSGYASGWVRIRLGWANGINRNANGTFVENIICGAGNAILWEANTAVGNYSFDNVSCREVY